MTLRRPQPVPSSGPTVPVATTAPAAPQPQAGETMM